MAGITSSFTTQKDKPKNIIGYLRDDALFIQSPDGGVLRFYGLNDGDNELCLGVFSAEKAENWGDKKVRVKGIHFELEEV